MPTRISINPQMTRWALQRAGVMPEDFTRNYPQLPVLEWLAGTKQPTVKQYEDFARKLHVPFGYLFLSEPPQEALNLPFFRQNRTTHEPSLAVRDMVMLLERRQAWLSEFLQDEGQAPLDFVGRFSLQDDYREIVAAIRKRLALAEDWASQCKTQQDALNHLSEHIEESGVVITFNSVVGNNSHRSIPVEECRGFVLVDRWSPFLFVNAADAKTAQAFTLVHEYAHVWLGQSAGFDVAILPPDDPLEQLCNQVAAEFLVPEELFRADWQPAADFEKLGRRYRVSPIVVARRAMDLNLINRGQFFAFYKSYQERLENIPVKDSAGGDFYRTANKRLSLRFTAFVNQAVQSGKLLYRDAFRLTGLKADTYQTFMDKAFNAPA